MADKSVHEVEPGTPVKRKLEREIKGVLQTDLTDEAGVHHVFTGPCGNKDTGASIEIEGADRRDVEVIDGSHVNEFVEQTGIKFEEAGAGVVLIGKLGTIGGTDTEGLRLGRSDSCETEERNCDDNKFFH